jgi:cytochrome c oxidase cbb3-type subunit 2
MPPYAFLAEKALDYRDIQDKIRAMTKVGVPYTQDMIDNAKDDLETQADPFAAASKFQARYGGKVIQRDFDGEPDRLSEMDALIAYLQMLGTLVDFSTYEAKAPENRR